FAYNRAMRIWRIAVVLLVASIVPRGGLADVPPSPRLTALAAKVAKDRGAEEAFWKQVADEGTPLVEDIKDPKGRLLVSFVYRARPGVKAVAMYGAPGGINGYARLEPIAGTHVFAYRALVDPAARFSYRLAPGDDF